MGFIELYWSCIFILGRSFCMTRRRRYLFNGTYLMMPAKTKSNIDENHLSARDRWKPR